LKKQKNKFIFSCILLFKKFYYFLFFLFYFVIIHHLFEFKIIFFTFIMSRILNSVRFTFFLNGYKKITILIKILLYLLCEFLKKIIWIISNNIGKITIQRVQPIITSQPVLFKFNSSITKPRYMETTKN